MTSQWEILRVENLHTKYFYVVPHGRINFDDLLPRPKEITYSKLYNADELRFENEYDATKARHFLIDILGNNGWEPFAVDDGSIYFKRIQS